MRNHFDRLLDEILTKSLTDTDEDDERISAAAGEDGGEVMSPKELSVAKLFTQITNVLMDAVQQIKDLKAEVEQLKGRSAGKPMHKSLRLDGGVRMGFEELLAKALEAQTAGRITGAQVAITESHLNLGLAPPSHILRAILAEDIPAAAA